MLGVNDRSLDKEINGRDVGTLVKGADDILILYADEVIKDQPLDKVIGI